MKMLANRNEPVKATSNILQIDDDFSQANTSNGFNSSIKRKSGKKSKYFTLFIFLCIENVRNEIIELSDTENVSTIRTDKNEQ